MTVVCGRLRRCNPSEMMAPVSCRARQILEVDKNDDEGFVRLI